MAETESSGQLPAETRIRLGQLMTETGLGQLLHDRDWRSSRPATHEPRLRSSRPATAWPGLGVVSASYCMAETRRSSRPATAWRDWKIVSASYCMTETGVIVSASLHDRWSSGQLLHAGLRIVWVLHRPRSSGSSRPAPA